MILFGTSNERIGRMCRHAFPNKGKVVAVSSNNPPTVKFLYECSAEPDYCPACMWKGRGECAWCGLPILLEQNVTLYSPKAEHWQPRKAHHLMYTRKPIRLVGCMACADQPEHRAGRWMRRSHKKWQFYVERTRGRFETEQGTIAISQYTPAKLEPSKHTARQLVSPIPIAGNELVLTPEMLQHFAEPPGTKVQIVKA